MGRRTLTAPPALAGFEYVSLVGSGGYADVFLYQQSMPNRSVAIKVLDTASLPDGAGQADFTAEANLMASVSAHPYIVQVFHADIAPDGRPYLIMEFYSGPNFYERARAEKLSVAEALRVGVQLSSAVEAAHRGGPIRDIKPANVLTSEYRRPGLTDFGIAAVQGPGTDTADGVSIPWSPPEALGDSPADRRSDIYSLAATVYTLLAGRSPFEVAGGDNRHLALIGRIERNPVPSIGRADVPASFERVLAGAMSKDPVFRPATAAEFGRQLQSVESEMHLAVTELELAEEQRPTRSRVDDDDDDSTRVKGVTEVHAQDDPPGISIDGVPARPHSSGAMAERTREGILGEPDVDETMHRSASQQDELPELAPRAGLDRKWLIAGGVAAALVAAVLSAVVLGGGGDSGGDAPQIDEAQINDNIGQPIAVTPSPLQEVVVVDNGDSSYTFTWEDRGGEFTYAVTPDGSLAAERVVENTFDAFVECIEIEVIGDSGLISAPTRVCA